MKKLPANYASLSTIFFRALIFFSIFFISGYLKAQPQVSFSPLIQNLTLPVEITNANDGSNRLFIVEQGGVIKIFKNGAVLANPFIDF